ncbi:hypothetical protein H8A87_01415 [Xenorhabdus sp. VLS]|uniref:Uncharacterized protein n=1 Tax=Xenorhabdus lircayensis TaxID=2763499 RepID=A0ABS0U0N6_9GAMM|nr:hypothetical protein [Xenorhabdus lircayensis]
MDERIFLAGDVHNFEATLGVIRRGYFSDFIIDEITADFLLSN